MPTCRKCGRVLSLDGLHLCMCQDVRQPDPSLSILHLRSELRYLKHDLDQAARIEGALSAAPQLQSEAARLRMMHAAQECACAAIKEARGSLSTSSRAYAFWRGSGTAPGSFSCHPAHHQRTTQRSTTAPQTDCGGGWYTVVHADMQACTDERCRAGATEACGVAGCCEKGSVIECQTAPILQTPPPPPPGEAMRQDVASSRVAGGEAVTVSAQERQGSGRLRVELEATGEEVAEAGKQTERLRPLEAGARLDTAGWHGGAAGQPPAHQADAKSEGVKSKGNLNRDVSNGCVSTVMSRVARDKVAVQCAGTIPKVWTEATEAEEKPTRLGSDVGLKTEGSSSHAVPLKACGALSAQSADLFSQEPRGTTYYLLLTHRILTTHHLLLTTSTHCLPLTTHYSLLSTHYLALTTQHSLLTTHHSPLTTHYSLLTTHHPLLTTHYSLLSTRDSLLTTHYSLLTTHYSLLTTHSSSLLTLHCSLLTPHLTTHLTTHYSLLTPHYSLLTTHYLLLTTYSSLLATYSSLLATYSRS